MKEIFLSASVPEVGRGKFFETADPFLIQIAVRELVSTVIRTHRIVWGGHPSITPMIWSICEDLGCDYSQSVVLYQSRFFEDRFPEENRRFNNVQLVDAENNDRSASLYAMRHAMLSRENLSSAVFIGGMEGIADEYELFKGLHPEATVVPVAAAGGAALDLAKRIRQDDDALYSVNFAYLFHREFMQERHDFESNSAT